MPPVLFKLSESHPGRRSTARTGGAPPFLRHLATASAPQSFAIAGVTKDSAGAILGGCVVQLFRTVGDAFVTEVVSDPTTGAYSIPAGPGESYYIVAYKAGAPDVAGTTVNTLVAA